MVRFGLVLTVLLAISVPAFAQRARRPSEPAGYRTAIQSGMRAAVQQDFSTALTSFRQAAGLHPESAEPHFFIAEVMRMQNELEDALGELRTAVRLAQATGRDADAWHARALFATAATLQMLGRFDEAREAWVAYNTFADGHPQVSYSSSGRAHLQALDRRTEVARVAAGVRERIEQRAREAAEEASRPRRTR
ncbi:MAG: hypothetical protein IT379_12480 [Deltaproteobacteria bacterium]|nr:hypothetical protein [Deltaproteobacteria bacterium]